jgi:D-alanyl-D-alanine carboxypeptidase
MAAIRFFGGFRAIVRFRRRADLCGLTEERDPVGDEDAWSTVRRGDFATGSIIFARLTSVIVVAAARRDAERENVCAPAPPLHEFTRELKGRHGGSMAVPRLRVFFFVCLAATAGRAEMSSTPAHLDEVASRYFKADEPGAVVLVMRDGIPLLRKAYGLGDLEQSVPMRADAVFEIGSITKQFTAVAILQLVEEGKIHLSDDITRFLPDYPTHGKTITIAHLLTHTSGIQDYSEMPTFLSSRRQDVTPQELVDRFKNQPMDFDPGTRWKYDNSGYILLGEILEKVSGEPYAGYVRKHLLSPAGLMHTTYGDAATIIPNRVRGYEKEGDHYVNAGYLSLTWTYAAGALLSTVDDLARWMAAVTAGRLLSAALLQRAWTSSTLPDGSKTGYGYGWQVGTEFGIRYVQHGGQTIGFTSSEVWMPESKIFVAVLSNVGSGGVDTDFVANQLASYAAGKPYPPVAVVMPKGELEQYAGVYQIDGKNTRTISVENGQLYSQHSGGAKLRIVPSARDAFFFDRSLTTMRFERDASGKISAMVMDPVFFPSTTAIRIGGAPAAPTEIVIDPAKLGRYAGRYEIAPGFVLTISRRGDALWAQATGQEAAQIYPRSESVWFLKMADAQLTFSFGADGSADALTLHQSGKDVHARKLP